MSPSPSTTELTHVLVVDDDPFNLRLLRELCVSMGCRVTDVSDGESALAVARREVPDLVLLDIAMPGIDGLSTLSKMKADSRLARVPVILVTGTGDSTGSARGLELGAVDFVTKPFRVFEIQQRIRNVFRSHPMHGGNARRTDPETVDPLTHAGSTRELVARLDYEYARARRYGEAFTCVVVRIANQSELSENAGADGVDGALVQLAAGLRGCVRGVDHVFRSDLDEFTLVLPQTGEEGARALAHRVADKARDGSLWGASLRPRPVLDVAHATFPTYQVDSGEALRLEALTRLHT